MLPLNRGSSSKFPLGPNSQHRDRRSYPRALPRPYLPPRLLGYGASSGDVRRMEQARRPRARLVTSPPGGPGTPAGRHYDRSARSSLDWDRGSLAAAPRPRKPGPGLQRMAAWPFARAAVERREAGTPIATGAPRLASADCSRRLAALRSPWGEDEGMRRSPRVGTSGRRSVGLSGRRRRPARRIAACARCGRL
jgi:hypothetical protein